MSTKKLTTERPHGIEITATDRKAGKSRSFTVYKTTVEEVFEELKKALGVD